STRVQRTPGRSGRSRPDRMATVAGSGHTATNSLTPRTASRHQQPHATNSLTPRTAPPRPQGSGRREAPAQEVEQRDGCELADPVPVTGQVRLGGAGALAG